MRAYPSDSYPRLIEAMSISETAALKSASWGLGQVLGKNYISAGYSSVQEMVASFCDDEENHLNAMVTFILSNNLDDDLRRHDWHGFAAGYNGPGYSKNRYAERLDAAYRRWSKIKNTKWSPEDARIETETNVPAILIPERIDQPPVPVPVPVPSVQKTDRGFFSRFWESLISRRKS